MSSVPKRLKPVSDIERHTLYEWVDSFPLSRSKKNISRDFSDGVLIAEVISLVAPSCVDIHNYTNANSVVQKMYNWNTLNAKVFKRLGMFLNLQDLEDCANVCCLSSFLLLASLLVRGRSH